MSKTLRGQKLTEFNQQRSILMTIGRWITETEQQGQTENYLKNVHLAPHLQPFSILFLMLHWETLNDAKNSVRIRVLAADFARSHTSERWTLRNLYLSGEGQKTAGTYPQGYKPPTTIQAEVFPLKLCAAVSRVQDARLKTLVSQWSGSSMNAVFWLADLYPRLIQKIETPITIADSTSFLLTVWQAKTEAELLVGTAKLEAALKDVPDPAKALTLLYRLLAAAYEIEALKDQLRDPLFVDELVKLALEYAKLDPKVLEPVAGEKPFNFFLNTLMQKPEKNGWNDDLYVPENGNLRQGTRELREFLKGFTTPEKRFQMVRLARQLLETARKVDALKETRPNPKVINHLLKLGQQYGTIDPVINQISAYSVGAVQSFTASAPTGSKLFLETLWRSDNAVPPGSNELTDLLKDVDIPATALKYERKLLSTLQKVTVPNEQMQSVEAIGEIVSLGALYTSSRTRNDKKDVDGFFLKVFQTNDTASLQSAASQLEIFLENVGIPSNFNDEEFIIPLPESSRLYAAAQAIPLIGGAVIIVVAAWGIAVYWQETNKQRIEILKIAIRWTMDTIDGITDRIVSALKQAKVAADQVIEGARKFIRWIVATVFAAKKKKNKKENRDDSERDPSQDQLLNDREIQALNENDVDAEGLKPNARYDLYKDKQGNIYVKPKGGRGPGEETGYNIRDFLR